MTEPPRANLRYADLDDHRRKYEQLSDLERSILEKVNRKVGAAPSLEKVLDVLFMWTRSIDPCERICLAFVEENGTRITARHVVASYPEQNLRAGYSEELDRSSLREVIDQGVLRIIGDLQEYLEQHPDSRSTRLMVREGIRSSMTCPLSVDRRNVGVLFRCSTQPHAFGDRQIQLHLAVAERLGQVVERAYRIAQLQVANQAYLEMLTFVSHELKSPVASLVSDGMLLKEGYLGELNLRQADRVNRMIAKGDYLLGLVHDYLNLARVEDGELRARLQPVADLRLMVLEPALEILRPQVISRGMNLEVQTGEKPISVECDPGLMKIVVVNLLSNAVKYGREGGEIRISLRPTEDGVALAVWNQGPGFPEDQRHRLFRRFSRLTTPVLMRQKGTGVGLYTSWRIMRLHRGTLKAASQVGAWAEFTAQLPGSSDSSST